MKNPHSPKVPMYAYLQRLIRLGFVKGGSEYRQQKFVGNIQ